MAHVQSIWVHESNKELGTMKVTVVLQPAGEVVLKVPVPKKFHAILLEMAQTAADAHEAQMHASIIGDKHDADKTA